MKQLIFICIVSILLIKNLNAQDYSLVAVTGVVSGNETNNTLFKAIALSTPSLAYIRAQKIKGPQDGYFTQHEDNIRYTSVSKAKGIPANLSRIRFTFLKEDRITHIKPGNFRFGINDIDGPNNEALATNCNEDLRFLGTASSTNILVVNMPPNIMAVGAIEENEGPTSRVMFQFDNVSVVELGNYANDGYLKDFDLNDDYPITKPILVKCNGYTSSIYTQFGADTSVKESSEFINERSLTMVNTRPIYFDTDKFNIRKDAEIELLKVVFLMRKYPELIIELNSHTDSKASDEYNVILSEKRAKNTVKWIIDRGVNPLRIKGKGFGETKLINNCSNGVKCTESEHQKNRRTEFIVKNSEVINFN